MLSFFPRGVLDEILNLIESVSEGFPSYSYVATIIKSETRPTSMQLKKASKLPNVTGMTTIKGDLSKILCKERFS